MEHLFVPLELARLAKEKGFNELCFAWYNAANADKLETSYAKNSESWLGKCCTAPLYQQLVDWFLKKFSIQVEVAASFQNGEWVYYPAIKAIMTDSENGCISHHNYPGVSSDKYRTLTSALTHAFTLI